MGDYDKVKYNNDYNKENYDIIRVPFPKGMKEKLKTAAKERGSASVSAYIKQLVAADLEKIRGG